MPEHESAVAAWLDSPSTKREMEIVRKRFTSRYESPSPIQCAMFALMVEMLAALDVYGADVVDIVEDPIVADDDDDEEAWKK